MFATHTNHTFFRSAVCMMLAAVIVASSLAFGAIGMQQAATPTAIVTVTQLA